MRRQSPWQEELILFNSTAEGHFDKNKKQLIVATIADKLSVTENDVTKNEVDALILLSTSKSATECAIISAPCLEARATSSSIHEEMVGPSASSKKDISTTASITGY